MCNRVPRIGGGGRTSLACRPARREGGKRRRERFKQTRFMRNHTMFKLKLAKPMLVALAACAASVAFNGVVFADDAQTQALKDQMRIMQEQMQDLQRKIEALSKQQAAPPAVAAPPAPPAAAGPTVAKAPASTEPLFDKFVKGFYGTLDVSIDDVTKGMNGFVAYPYSYVDPTNPFRATA